MFGPARALAVAKSRQDVPAAMRLFVERQGSGLMANEQTLGEETSQLPAE
jgi:hypothetical protein